YEVVVEDKTLFFRAASNAKAAVLTVTPNDHLREFFPCLSTPQQVTEVNVRGWSPKDKKWIAGKASSGDEVSAMGGQKSGPKAVESAFGAAAGVIGTHPVMSQAEADQFAKALFNDMALAYIRGDGVCWGRTDLRSGKVIKIDGIGKRFSGQY